MVQVAHAEGLVVGDLVDRNGDGGTQQAEDQRYGRRSRESHRVVEVQQDDSLKRVDREHICYDTQCVVGIDVGKAQDSTVVTVGIPDYSNPIIMEQATEAGVPDYVLYDVRILDWLEIVGDNYEEQYYKIMDFLGNFTVKCIVIDGTGVGSPVADRLAANLKCPVIPFVFTVPSKSALMKYFDAYLKAQCFHYPASPNTSETIEYKKFVEQFL